jgi:hypothetical protein
MNGEPRMRQPRDKRLARHGASNHGDKLLDLTHVIAEIDVV